MDKDKDKRIQELERENADLKNKLEKFENDPTARFYAIFCGALEDLGEHIKNKTLDLKNDAFMDSIVYLAEKSDKIFAGLAKGRESFEEKKDDEKPINKKAAATKTTAFKAPTLG